MSMANGNMSFEAKGLGKVLEKPFAFLCKKSMKFLFTKWDGLGIIKMKCENDFTQETKIRRRTNRKKLRKQEETVGKGTKKEREDMRWITEKQLRRS